MEMTLLHELLSWVDSRERTYAEAMEAWRSHCPRHPVWDDALVEGLIEVESGPTMATSRVRLTATGKTILAQTPR
jgi:hypothetical protein